MLRRLNRVRSAAGYLFPSPRGLKAALAGSLTIALLLAPAASGDGSAENGDGADRPPAADGGAPAPWRSDVELAIEDSEYHVTWQHETRLPDRRAAWQAPNRAHGLRTYFTDDGIHVIPRDAGDEPSWEWGLKLAGYGRAGAIRAVERPTLTPETKRIEYYRGPVREWYVNDRRGLEQGFTLAAPPEETTRRAGTGAEFVPGARDRSTVDAEGHSPAYLGMTLAGTLVPHVSTDGQAVDFASHEGGPVVLHLSKLEVRDAIGRELSSWFELFPTDDGLGLRLVFDDADAVYPVIVDPLLRASAWTAEGDQDGAGFGYSISTAGDVNGDGFDDVIVGAPYFDAGQMDEGRAHVYHGSASGLETTPAWIMEPDATGVLFGLSASTAGDVNDDGYDDVIVGAPHYGLGEFHEGGAWVYRGSPTGLEATAAWHAEPDVAGARFGHSVATAGDVDNDGYDDVVIGAPDLSAGQAAEGAAYVYHGSATGLGTHPAWVGEGGQAGAHLGRCVATAGDVNDDDHDDVILGATDSAFVHHGSASGVVSPASWSESLSGDFGYSVSTAGDVNGDGFDDVIVGAPLYTETDSEEGGVWVYHGGASGVATSPAWSTRSRSAGGRFGQAVSAGDADGDGYDDVLVGADDSGRGRVYLYQGSATGLDPVGPGCCWEWTLVGDAPDGSGLGRSVSLAADVNGDGVDDVLVGAPFADSAETDEGVVHAFHGSQQVLSPLDLIQGLGFDDTEIGRGYYYTLYVGAGQPIDNSSDAVGFGPIPNSVLISNGRASDGGLGSTDYMDDESWEYTRYTMVLDVPPEAQTLRFTTQWLSSEYDAGNPGRDRVELTYQYYTGSGTYAETGLDAAIEELASGAVNPPMSHAVSVQGKTSIGIHIQVYDEVDGLNDSALLLSNAFFSDIALPSYIEGPDIDEDDIVDYYLDTQPHDVSLQTGSFAYAKELISVPGISMPFALNILYNSGSVQTGTVGVKWSHSFESYAYQLEDADVNGYPDHILVRYGSGIADYFEESDGLGGYQPKFAGSHSALTYEAPGGDITITLTTKDHLTYEFVGPATDPPAPYWLKRVDDSNGNNIQVLYDEYNRIDKVEDTRGEDFLFDYGDDGLLDAVEYAAATAEVRFGYDDRNHLVWVEDLNGDKTHFTYDSHGNLLTVADAEGTALVSNSYESYQGLGIDQTGYRVISQRDGRDPDLGDPLGGLQIAYDGESLTHTDRLDRQTTSVFDIRGRLSRRTDAAGGEWTFAYDADGNTTQEVNPQQTPTVMEYDAFGNQTSRTEAFEECAGGVNRGDPCTADVDCPASSCGSRTTMTYDARHNLETSTDHLDHTTTYTYYPASDNLESEADPLGNTLSYTYFANGQMETKTTRRGTDATDPVFGAGYTYEYDALGYLERETDPLTHVTSYTYDALGHKTGVTDPRTHTTSYVHDKVGQLLSETNPLGETTRYTYDLQGRLTSLQEHSGAMFAMTYTPTGKLESLTDPLGHSIHYEYDAEDRVDRQLDPLGRPRTFEYDLLDNPTRVVDRDGLTEASSEYDELGNQTKIVDPRGYEVTYDYDLLGREMRETDPRCNEDPPDPRCASGLLAVSRTYDGRGLETSLTNQRGQTVSYGYDDAGRLTQADLLGGDTITHTLDAEGNRTASVSTRLANVARSFDALERPLARADTFGNTIGYQYDPAGNLRVLTYSDGKTVTYSYDGLNRLVAVCDWNCNTLNCDPDVPDLTDCTATYAYDEVGNLTEASLPDGSTITYTYDAGHQLVGVSDTNPTAGTIFAASYTLNAAGERTSADLTLPLDPVLALSDESFTHNQVNEIDNRGADSYAYDEDGNMTSGVFGGAVRTLVYDELNRLAQIDADTFEYDVEGVRIRATRAGQTRRFVYDPTGEHLRLLEEHDDNGTIVARYVYGLGLIAREDAGGVHGYHFDSRGSTVALTDAATGTIQNRYAYAPYGLVVARQESVENPFTFNGRDGVVDDGNGLYFMRVRYYAPDLMRFIQKDQTFEGLIQVSQSLNRHAFVMGNPIQFVDPNGEASFDEIMSDIIGVLTIVILVVAIALAVVVVTLLVMAVVVSLVSLGGVAAFIGAVIAVTYTLSVIATAYNSIAEGEFAPTFLTTIHVVVGVLDWILPGSPVSGAVGWFIDLIF